MTSPFPIRFVLVRPSSALNIGAVARALANFGFDDLAAVSPHDPRWREAQSASYGSDLLQRARVGTLQEVTEDCSLVLGTASAHNRTMRRTVVTLPALRTWLKRRLPKGGRAALLLGSEKHGLDNEELSLCHAVAQAGVNSHMSPSLRRQKLRRGLYRWRLARGDAAWLRNLLERLSAGA